jgi:hypothetical protein
MVDQPEHKHRQLLIISPTFDVFGCHGCSTEKKSITKIAKKPISTVISHFFMLSPPLEQKHFYSQVLLLLLQHLYPRSP